jgi:ribosome-binding factor A
MSELRLRKVESFLGAEISRLISSNTLKDPRIDSLVTVAGVRVAKDLTSARVYVSYYGDEQVLAATVAALNHAAGFIQARIGRQLRMRHTPKLRFITDTSILDGFRVTQQLKDVER